MAGFTPVFDTVFEGSLCGQYPDTAAWLFLLALCDKDGLVDKSPDYISAVTGMPKDVLSGCIERFMQPDPNSRTADDDGRRLALIDPSRPWGWRVINHGRYRAKARKKSYDDERTLDGSDAERKRVERQASRSAAGPTPEPEGTGHPTLPEPVPIRPDASRRVPLSDAEAKASPEAEAGEDARAGVPRGTSEPEIYQHVCTLKAKYPKAAREDWIEAEKRARRLVDDGAATWQELEAGVDRYARCCRDTSRPAMNPAKFFDPADRDRPWAQAWHVPTASPRPAAAGRRARTVAELEAEARLRGGDTAQEGGYANG